MKAFDKVINDTFKYSVVVSANPEDSKCNLEEEIRFAFGEIGEVDEIYYIGMSNGAIIGAQQGYRIPQIKKMLLINGPLMINWLQTKKGLENFRGEKAEMLYGSEDPSYRYFELIENIDSDVVKSKCIRGVDHNFTGQYESLEWYVTKFLK